jgi:hypothetical protein
VDQYVEKLRGVANGKTEVPVMMQFSAITLNIIGKVNLTASQNMCML